MTLRLIGPPQSSLLTLSEARGSHRSAAYEDVEEGSQLSSLSRPSAVLSARSSYPPLEVGLGVAARLTTPRI